MKSYEKSIEELKLKVEQRNVLLLHMQKKLGEVIPQDKVPFSLLNINLKKRANQTIKQMITLI